MVCVACRSDVCRCECRGLTALPARTEPRPMRHYQPPAPAGSGTTGRFANHRDSMATLHAPEAKQVRGILRSSSPSSSSLSSSSSTSSASLNQLRCVSPASISSLSSLGSLTYSSSFSSIDDLDEQSPNKPRRPGQPTSPTYRLQPEAKVPCRRRRQRVSFHPNVLLWTAVQQGDFVEMENILSQSAPPSSRGDMHVHDRLAVNTANHQGITPLHLCCFAGVEECVRLLIRHGAVANCGDDDGWTPLHAACVGGHLGIVTDLVRAGGDMHREDHFGRTALDVASGKARKHLLQLSSDSAEHSYPRPRVLTGACTEV